MAALHKAHVGRCYFLQAEDGGPIKIGFTGREVAERVKAIQRCSPVPLVVLGDVLVQWWVELELHRILGAHRLHGEWFTDCEEVREAMDILLGRKDVELGLAEAA